MIQITPQMKILVAVEPVDFRQGIDGLAQSCRARLHSEPFSWTVFIFRSRSGLSIKVRDVNYLCAPATTTFVHLRGAEAEPTALPSFSTAAA